MKTLYSVGAARCDMRQILPVFKRVGPALYNELVDFLDEESSEALSEPYFS